MVLPIAQQFGRCTFENFYPAQHAEALENLQAMLAGHGERAVYLTWGGRLRQNTFTAGMLCLFTESRA